MASIACFIDDAELRDRLRKILALQPDANVVVAGADETAVREVCRASRIDVVCFNQMVTHDFLELRERIFSSIASGEHPRLVVLAEGINSAFVYRGLAFGIDDVIDIGRGDDHIAASFDAIICGDGPAFMSYLVKSVDAAVDVTRLRIVCSDAIDKQIVPMIAAGYTDREIADVLHYSHQVIRNRISRILLRSGIRNRTQLASAFVFGRLLHETQNSSTAIMP